MADATTTVKLTPSELNVLRQAVREAVLVYKERVKTFGASDRVTWQQALLETEKLGKEIGV